MRSSNKRNRAIKIAINYEESVPRCDNCVSFRQAGLHLIDSLPHYHHPRCIKHQFQPKALGCCDDWQGRDGDVLIAN